MNRLLILFALLSAALLAQDSTQDYRFYFAHRTSTGSGEVLTFQQPTALGRESSFQMLLVTAPTACTITLEINGTAATTTALTVSALNTKADAARLKGFSASNVGVGTVVAKYSVPASQTFPILKGGLTLAAVPNQNYTFRTDCPSGTEFTHIHVER